MTHNPYVAPVLAAALAVTAAGAFVLWRRSRTPGATEFSVVAATMALTSFAYAAELASSSLQAKLAWLSVRWVGICGSPVALIAFVRRWSAQRWEFTPARVALVAAVPLVTLVLAWTNEWHHWIATPSVLVSHGAYSMRHAEGRWAFWLFVVYCYAALGFAAASYLRMMFVSPLHFQQGAILLVATLVPWAANFAYLAGWVSDPDLDVSPFGYAAAAALWAFGLVRTRFLELAPIARDQVFDGLTNAILVVDGAGRLVDWNPSAARLFGRNPAEMLGLALRELVGQDVAARVAAGERVLETALLGRALVIEATPLRLAPPGDARVLTLRDVSEERRAQHAREAALRLAESAARARTELLARVSHEVRTPLHAVVSASDLLLDEPLSARSRQYVLAIADSSRAMLAVVDELLDFAKLDAGRIEVQTVDMDARSVLEDVARQFAAAAEKAGISLLVEAPPLTAHGDPVRVRQVLSNLVSNALKFTTQGVVQLRARALSDRIRFEVEDTGSGIPEHAHARIFEPFVQVGPAREGVSGTGLGLAIAKHLVTLMQGEIGVTSRVGEGSTFWFTLLRAADEIARAAEPHTHARTARRGRVLVVDDIEVHRFVTRALLEREGCEVDVAANARDALARLGAHRYSLVVTDVRMADGDGFQLAESIRSSEAAGPRTPIVALSADVHEDAARRAKQVGMDDWLAKPVDPARLRAVLDRFVPPESEEAISTSAGAVLDSHSDLSARVLASFQSQLPLDLEAIQRAVASNDEQTVRERAHALAGAADIVGATTLANVCRRLANPSTPLETVRALVPVLENEGRVISLWISSRIVETGVPKPG